MAGLSCGATMAKYILCLFNIVFFLCGAVILGVSLWLKFDDNAQSYMEVINFDQNNPFLDVALNILILVGVLIFLTGFLGCYGAWKENSCMLTSYAGLVILILIGQLVGIGLALHFRNMLNTKLETSMKKQANGYVRHNKDYTLTKAWGVLQHHFECCGGTGHKDYDGNKYMNETMPIPGTCCAPSGAYDDCIKERNNTDTSTNKLLYTKGCYEALTDFLKDNITIVVGVIFGVILIEICGIVFACCVKKELTDYKQV